MKKNRTSLCWESFIPIRKYFRIMKLTFTLLLLGLMSFASVTYSQATKLTFESKNATIESIFKQIESLSEYKFAYNSTKLDVEKKITMKVENQSIDAILNKILGSANFKFQIVDRYIIITDENSTGINSMVSEQSKKVTGKVSDTNGGSIPGVSVVVKGTTNGTITDVGGNYSISNVSENATLQYSFVGMKGQEIIVGSKTNINVVLQEETIGIEEVVAIGYGSAKKRDLTGSVSSIKAESLSIQAPRNVQDILRSNAAGLNIGIATDAKAEASLAIRGKGTLAASSDPLLVLDGVIYEGALADINPQDISSIEVLKDASSAAVYGSKAANGVIVITTKRGKTGKPIINVNSNIAISRSASQPRVLDSEGFLKFRQDYNEGRNSEAYLAKYPQIFSNPFELNGANQLDWYNYDQKTPATYVNKDQLTTQWLSRLNFTTPEIENYFAGNITNWDDLVFQNAIQQDYTVSVSNATDYTTQYLSLGWTDREGVITGDRYKNLRARVNLESKIASFLTVGLNSQFASRNEGFLKCNWSQMTMISPYGSNNLDDPESIYQRRPTGLDPINPFYDNKYTDRKDMYYNLSNNLYAKVSLPFGIEYQMNYTPNLTWHEYYNHYSSEGESWTATGGQSIRTNSKTFNWQIDNVLRWKNEFAKIHKVEITLLSNSEKGQYWSTTANASNYSPSDILGYHRLQAGAVPTVSSNDTYRTGDALMGRVFYSVKNKYMLTTSIRRDGYSAFGKKNPHAVFPSVALGWTFTEEKFLKSADSWLDYGKLRISWGENGNRDIGQYAALSQMSSSLRPYIDQSGNVYTTSQIYVSTMSNYNLKWERTASFNLGLDFSLFQNILSGTLDGYISKTNDLLVSRALPDITGFTNVTSNLGQLQNKGLELTLNANILTLKDLRWTASGNFSMNRRKINKLYGDMVDIKDDAGNIIAQKEADDETNGWFIGQDPDRIWAYERTGVWQLDELSNAAIYGCQPGDFKYKDQNNDGIMNNKDNVFQGYSTPRFRWTLRNELIYKDFSLSATIYSYWKYYGAFQRSANNYAFPDRTSDYDFPRWTKTNPINDYARIGSKNIGTNWVNRSFIRLENVSLSYNLPKNFLQMIYLQALRFSVSIQNAGVWAPNWNFWDPESGSATPRTFNFGVNLTL